MGLQLSLFEWLRPLKRSYSGPTQPKTRGLSKCAELEAIWTILREKYFPSIPELDNYLVQWSSRRQKRTLASCNISDRRVIVAKELNNPDCFQWWEPLLYHEMCHAAIGTDVERRGRKRLWHGQEFRTLESRHPLSADLNLWVRNGGWRNAVMRDRNRRKAR